MLLAPLELLVLLASTRGDVSSKERNAVQLFPFFLVWVVWVFLMSVFSYLQERPSTSHMCVWSFTQVGPRALQSTNAPRKMARGCPTSITVAPVRARITKSTGALFGLGRMSSRRSAQMSSVTSPPSLGATWPSQLWRAAPVPITLTTALYYRYVTWTKSVGWFELSSCSIKGGGFVPTVGCTAPLLILKGPYTGKMEWRIQRRFWRKGWAFDSAVSKYMVQSKIGGIKDDLSLGIMEVFGGWMQVSACLESNCGHFASFR